MALGLLVLLAVIGYSAVQRYSNGGAGAPYCTVTASGEQRYEMTPEQAANAATIAAVGISKGLPDRAVTIALATAMQESALRNLDHGDRDSLGLFQQRPSMGWGTPEQITDPVYSAGIFYDRLADVPGYSRLPLTVAAQKVQRSGFPQAYAKHETDAAVLTAAFGEGGGAPATLSCSGPAAMPGDPQKVRHELTRAFGRNALGSARDAKPAGLQAAPPAGNEISLRLEPDGGPGEARRGRAMAYWAVARAHELGIARVSYDRVVWAAGRSRGQWQRAEGTGADAGGDPRGRVPDEVRILVAR